MKDDALDTSIHCVRLDPDERRLLVALGKELKARGLSRRGGKSDVLRAGLRCLEKRLLRGKSA